MKTTLSVLRTHDGSGSCTLDFTEFAALQQYLQALRRAFCGLQADGASGKLSLPQAAAALESLGYALDMQPQGAFYKLVESFDFERNGQLHLDTFVALAVQLRNARRCFEMFDPRRTGHVALDFNQLVWVMAQL